MTVKEMLYKDLFSVRMGMLEKGEDTDMIDGLLTKAQATHVSEEELMHDLVDAGLTHFAACIKNGTYTEMIRTLVKSQVYVERLEVDNNLGWPIKSSVQPVIEPHLEEYAEASLEASEPSLVKIPTPGFDGFGFPRDTSLKFSDIDDVR